MVSRSTLNRIAELEEQLKPQEQGPPYILITRTDCAIRDPDSLAPVEPADFSESAITGCRIDRAYTRRMPGESIDAMCLRAKATHWRERIGTPVVFATYPGGHWEHALQALADLPHGERTNDVRAQLFTEVIDRLPN